MIARYNNVYWCARVFSRMTDKQLGYIAFHEIIHMVSRAGDGNGVLYRVMALWPYGVRVL